MKIDTSINQYNCKKQTNKQIKCSNSSVHFTSINFRWTSYVDCNGIRRESQNTTGKRNDLDYDECARLIKKRFSKFSKINIMPMNGSDGTGTYLLAHSLLERFGEKKAKEKIFPITVTDVNPFIINEFGKKGIIALEPEDIKAFGKKFNKYFEEIPMSELPKIPLAYSQKARAFKLTPFFKNLFEFKVQDFQQRIIQVNDQGNSVVIIRNCLAQAFGYIESMLLVEKVDKQLKDSSMFIIGQYDRERMSHFVPDMKSLFKFKEIGKNIFSKQANLPFNKFTKFFGKIF